MTRQITYEIIRLVIMKNKTKKRWNARSISRKLSQEITAGKYPKNSLLPTREKLVKRFGVARATIDKAVNTLIDAGMIQSKRGAGSIIINTSRIYNIALIGNGIDIPPRHDISITTIRKESLLTASDRTALLDFDGIIWNMPEKTQLKWATALSSQIPQIVINRTPVNLNYISTNHTDAICKITDKRIQKHPDRLPVFLDNSKQNISAAVELRKDGFIQACEKHKAFYKLINMPEEFEDKIQLLKKEFDNNKGDKLIMVSGSLANTGAVVAWARETNRKWKKDILYSDFDNDYEKNVWGITVTSFIQNFGKMYNLAITNLIKIINGNINTVHILHLPIQRRGNT